MKFEPSDSTRTWRYTLGFLFASVNFFAVLYFILSFFGRIPTFVPYLYVLPFIVMVITLSLFSSQEFRRGLRCPHNIVANSFNVVLLTVVYVVGIGFTSVAAKLFGKHFLVLRNDKSKQSYWGNSSITLKPLDHYYRQF